ncbi:MAG: TolC family protein [bacterium]|nr:TolC family protein [bacterium]
MNAATRLMMTVAALLLLGLTTTRAAEPPVQELTLEEALRRAHEHHPRLAAARAREEAAHGRTRQAGLWSNPALIAGAEQLRTDTDQPDSRESILGFSQTIPLGGRVGKAREAARLDQEAQARQVESVRRAVEREVRDAFATALFQQRAREILAQGAEDLETGVSMARTRVQQGELAPHEIANVEMDWSRFKLDLERSGELARFAMTSLATAMGEPDRVPASLAGELEAHFELPSLEDVANSLALHPDVLWDEAQARGADARLKLARAERIPDVNVEVLFRRLEATDDRRLDMGLNVPLPLFNRNQGRVMEARAEVDAVRQRQRWSGQERRLRLKEAHQQLQEALARVRAQVDVIQPQAERILQAAQARHAVGELSLVEVLAARGERTQAQLEHLEALRMVMESWARLSEFVSI